MILQMKALSIEKVSAAPSPDPSMRPCPAWSARTAPPPWASSPSSQPGGPRAQHTGGYPAPGAPRLPGPPLLQGCATRPPGDGRLGQKLQTGPPTAWRAVGVLGSLPGQSLGRGVTTSRCPCPGGAPLPIPLFSSPGTHRLLSVSVGSSVLDISRKRNRDICPFVTGL